MIGGKNMSLEDVGLKMIIIVLVFLVLPTVIYMIVHDIIYEHRRAINQREFDEMSNTLNLSQKEKANCVLDFCEKQMNKYRWDYYYIPDIRDKKNK